MNYTKGPWNVRHSESKTAFNVIGTVPGCKYKIARCPYIITAIEELDKREKDEAEANAKLIAAAPDMLQVLTNFIEDYEGWKSGENDSNNVEGIYEQAKAAINKATS